MEVFRGNIRFVVNGNNSSTYPLWRINGAMRKLGVFGGITWFGVNISDSRVITDIIPLIWKLSHTRWI